MKFDTQGRMIISEVSIAAPEIRGASFSGGVSAIVAPTNDVPIYIREDCRIQQVIMLTRGGAGSCSVDIWRSSIGAYPPTVANSICSGVNPTITASAVPYSNSTLTGFTTTLSAGDTLLIHLNSSSTFTVIGVFLVLVPVGSSSFDGYTDERVRDVIGAALTDSSTIDFTYDDTADTITASVITTGLDLFTSLLKGVVPASGGGTVNFLRADGSWATPAPTGAALTKVDDTNVTLALGGSPTAALLAASSITAGWTGTLAKTRGGFGLDASGLTGYVKAAGAGAITASATIPYSDITGGPGADTVSLVANGYVTFGSGLIIQWGSQAAGGGALSFPITFPNAVFSVSVTSYNTANSGQGYNYYSALTTAGMTIVADNNGVTKWIAIGY
jgi:hypothetical protein